MTASDPRLTLARADLADAALEGRLPASQYRTVRRMRTAAPVAGIYRAADLQSERLDELVHGELFDVLEETAGFAWGQARRDGYVGFVALAALAAPGPAPTHVVRALSAYAFAEASFKSPALGPYSLNALVAIEAEDGDYARAADGAWFWRRHLSPIGVFERDPVAVAERFLGAAYLWGGRTSLGLDCSGLIQQALYACGRACPRDNDQQGQLGHGIAREDLARGDLVVWEGHIGLMLDEARLIHASAHQMATVIEPLDEAIRRIAARGDGAPTALRRI